MFQAVGQGWFKVFLLTQNCMKQISYSLLVKSQVLQSSKHFHGHKDLSEEENGSKFNFCSGTSTEWLFVHCSRSNWNLAVLIF